jgi:hypothetical protein
MIFFGDFFFFKKQGICDRIISISKYIYIKNGKSSPLKKFSEVTSSDNSVFIFNFLMLLQKMAISHKRI